MSKGTSKNRHNSGPTKSLFTSGTFVAWDGEGAALEDGTHVYTMLVNSIGTHIYNANGLPTPVCFDFLLDTNATQTRPINVCFGAGYDINMLLRDVPMHRIEQLWTTGRTTWRNYEIEYRNRKYLKVRRRGTPRFFRDANGKWYPNFTGTATLWDVFGFFQCRFVTAVEQYLGADYPTLDNIRDNKAKRSGFAVEDHESVLLYCQQECTALAEIMNRLRSLMAVAEITISRWDGAGAIAAELLRMHKIKESMGEYPQEVAIAAQSAYAGGRIEIIRYGNYIGPTYHYDVKSAYPSAMRNLPSLVGGTWYQDTNERRPFSVSRVRWKFPESNPFYPLFYREPDGSIIYPATGEGWYWEPEIHFALQYQQQYPGTLEILESWNLIPSNDDKPFLFVQEKYQLRETWKREKNAAEKVLKLGLNSLYGKLAQQLGGTADRKPPYYNLLWAGYITSATRARLGTLALQQPDAIIFFATDGIYSTERLEIEPDSGLGSWEYDKHTGITVAQSGVYYVGDGDEWAEYRRGYDSGSITRESIIDGWKRRQETIKASSTRFVGMGAALSGQRWRYWRTWLTIDRDLTLHVGGTKRMDTGPGGTVNHRKYPADRALRPTYAATNRTPEIPSHPFRLHWADDDGTTALIEDESYL